MVFLIHLERASTELKQRLTQTVVFFFISFFVPLAQAAQESTPPVVSTSSLVSPAAIVSTTPAVAPTPAAVVPASTSSDKAEFIGAAMCITCHQNRSSFHDSIHARAFAQAKGIEFEKSCETCHGPGSLHASAGGDTSNPGFAMIKSFKKMSARDLNESCLQCHQDQTRLHWIGSQHERRNVSCLACHSIHDPQEEKLLLVKPKVELVCAQCHKDIVARIHRNAHMPVAEGKMDCTSCHNPHGSATPKLLKADSANDTCYTCHADKRGPFLWEHPPARENCLNCHDPHGSHNEKMLVARMPFLCQRCHIGSGHPPTPFDQTSINAQNARSMTGSCTNCHPMVHGSNHPSGKYFAR